MKRDSSDVGFLILLIVIVLFAIFSYLNFVADFVLGA